MMTTAYVAPRIEETRTLLPHHGQDLAASTIDFDTAAMAGVSSVDHWQAYDMGIRGEGDLSGLCFRYWDPAEESFSTRFVRVKPDLRVAGRKYLQPVGERPRLYFIPGTTGADLVDTRIPVFITEGEKKSLALDIALRSLPISAVVVGIGGVWSWRYSPKGLQPNGRLGKGRSRPIPDLDLIRWSNRKAYLVLDSDVSTNWRVANAETALASELSERGVDVYILRFPKEGRWRRSA